MRLGLDATTRCRVQMRIQLMRTDAHWQPETPFCFCCLRLTSHNTGWRGNTAARICVAWRGVWSVRANCSKAQRTRLAHLQTDRKKWTAHTRRTLVTNKSGILCTVQCSRFNECRRARQRQSQVLQLPLPVFFPLQILSFHYEIQRIVYNVLSSGRFSVVVKGFEADATRQQRTCCSHSRWPGRRCRCRLRTRTVRYAFTLNSTGEGYAYELWFSANCSSARDIRAAHVPQWLDV